MLIHRTSPLSGKSVVQDIPVTNEQLEAWLSGELIQNAMPHLDAGQREFIKTGITNEEWETLFAGAD